MDFLSEFVSRVLPKCKTKISFILTGNEENSYEVNFNNGLNIKANCTITATHALYIYLKKYCQVNLSWNGNRAIELEQLAPFNESLTGKIEQKYRVYMNYCTLNYTMSWWDFSKWERELDFMALNGINMPLAVIGTEAVWYETLLQFGFTQQEALKTISGPTFWAWQLMTNIEGYEPPTDVKYVYDRLELGKKIIGRMLEFGMFPIQQGFSGHVPMSMKEKFSNAKILPKLKWCDFPQTAQLDPLDPLFQKFGTAYLNKQKELLGSYHFYATDPFHESAPPNFSIFYLRKVGKAIDKLFQDFDKNSVWVMQSWSLRKNIVKAVDKNNLLILDINSQKYKVCKNFWGYPFVTGYLHNFGGKNALQGRVEAYSKNCFTALKAKKINVVGSGLFMEGTEQNPYIYDMLFDMLTKNGDEDIKQFTSNYIVRRYGKTSKAIEQAFDILLQTCYKTNGEKENEVGSMIAARPQYTPEKASPCDNLQPFYDKQLFKKAVVLFASVSQEFKNSDGYQFDLTDFTRQAMSDLFYLNQIEYAKAAKELDLQKVKNIANVQLQLLKDLDNLLSCRSEVCLSRWVEDAHNLATNEQQKKYYDKCARLLITLWGDTNGACALYDYAWKEWSGLIAEYYLPRWQRFYSESEKSIINGKLLSVPTEKKYFGRAHIRANKFYDDLTTFELNWCNTYYSYDYPKDKDVTQIANEMIQKYLI
ncbi:MAG: alpha-N-acetylglucosaminidase TIM-barrel domain-containing protein [Clostridia bacterium]